MAFFGLEPNDLFERERQNARQQQGLAHGQEPDLAVYTWGEEGYDGLGDALLEGGDDFNDETFGGSGPVGTCPACVGLRERVLTPPMVRQGL
jgi:DNA topoisomerase 2-associated protein PAT1